MAIAKPIIDVRSFGEQCSIVKRTVKSAQRSQRAHRPSVEDHHGRN
jgi:hypothetical protein